MKFSNEPYYETLKGALKRVRSHGHYFSALCPLHDDNNPSLLVYHDGFICMGCQKRGSLAVLTHACIGGRNNIPAKLLADIKPFNNPFIKPDEMSLEDLAYLAHDTLCAFPYQTQYLKTRKVDSLIETARLGWWDGFYTFPAFADDDVFLALPTRAGPTSEKINGLRWRPCPPNLYVPSWPLFLRSKTIYIVYGIFDALSLAVLQVPVCTSTLGKHFDATWLDKYRTKKFFVIPDRAEEKEARELVAKIGRRGEKIIQLDYPEGCKDINDMHVKGYEQCLLAAL